jgi:hypothetical protein
LAVGDKRFFIPEFRARYRFSSSGVTSAESVGVGGVKLQKCNQHFNRLNWPALATDDDLEKIFRIARIVAACGFIPLTPAACGAVG